jgi:iron(III) transport system ATP-binding protein
MFLKVSNLKKIYDKDEPIIKSLNFSVNKGEIISFIGESGSGKTTFLRCLAGLEEVTSGKIELNGKILNDSNTLIQSHKRKIGFVFQDYPLFPHLNVTQNIILNLEKKYRSSLENILDLTNLNILKKRYPHELSGGEQQRVAIARAIIREPDLLLLDEPFSNLDLAIKSQIKSEIKRIVKDLNITTILVTHDIKDSLEISDRILIFKAGVLQQYDTPSDVYCKPANCYCAEMLGKLNPIVENHKNLFIRPESVNIVQNSDHEGTVVKSIFSGKEFLLKVLVGDNYWNLYSKNSYKSGCKIYLDFNKKDLIDFPENCKGFFNV